MKTSKRKRSRKSWPKTKILRAIKREYDASSLTTSWDIEGPDVRLAIDSLASIMESEYEFLDCTAVAGSRIVLKVIDRQTRDEFALKVCRPFKDAVSMVGREYRNIRDLYHPNLVRVFWSTELEIEGRDFRLPVTREEFIPKGQTLRDWLKRELDQADTEKGILATLKSLNDKFAQMLEGIHYLHLNRVFHCDIKPENIMIGGTTVKIVDFGYSKWRVPGMHNYDEKSGSLIGFTLKYALPNLRNKIRGMKTPEAAVALEDDEFSYIRIDHYALGRTIEECVNEVSERREDIEAAAQRDSPFSKSDYSRTNKYWESYMHLVAGRLKGQDSFDDFQEAKGEITKYPRQVVKAICYLEDITALKEAIRDLGRIDMDEMERVAPEWDNCIPDRIRVGHTDVPFTPRLRKLYNHAALARLARVSQLGLVGLVYPTARHSRLEHSMGSYANACRYIESLWSQKDDPFFRCVTSPEEVVAASLGALFHDLGQYPHCHDLEDALPGIGSHHLSTKEIYRREWKIGNKKTKSLFEVVKEEWDNQTANLVEKYLNPPDHDFGVSDPKAAILWGVISGPIDVDKLDYVQRDSLNLGVAYGRILDLDRLIQNLRPVVRPPTKGQFPTIKLGVTQKGVLPAHALVVAREQLIERVYWHKTVRSFKAMLATALRRGLKKAQKLERLIKRVRFFPSTELHNAPPEEHVESFHMTESDYAMLREVRELLEDPASEYLIDQILCRRPYHTFLDLAITEWISPSDRKTIERVLEPLRNTLQLIPKRYAAIEQARASFQKLLFQHRIVKEKPGLGRKSGIDLARDVAILIDVPGERMTQSTILVRGRELGQEHEIDLGALMGSSQHGWVKSLVPRIYLNQLFFAEEVEPRVVVDMLRKATRVIPRIK